MTSLLERRSLQVAVLQVTATLSAFFFLENTVRNSKESTNRVDVFNTYSK